MPPLLEARHIRKVFRSGGQLFGGESNQRGVKLLGAVAWPQVLRGCGLERDGGYKAELSSCLWPRVGSGRRP